MCLSVQQLITHVCQIGNEGSVTATHVWLQMPTATRLNLQCRLTGACAVEWHIQSCHVHTPVPWLCHVLVGIAGDPLT